MEQKQETAKVNKMREIEMEKLVFNCGATGDKLERSVKLLKMITGKKIKRNKSVKRIPSFEVRPGLETGCTVTIRKGIKELLERIFEGVDKKLKKKAIQENQFSFGIPEYIEVPGLEYDREIGIMGFEVTLVFKRKGKRVGIKKHKQGRIPRKQQVTPEEIIKFLQENFPEVELHDGKRLE